MLLTLCTANDVLFKRWRDILAEKHSVRKVSTLKDLEKAVSVKETDLFLMHREMISLDSIRQIRMWDSTAKIMITSDRPGDSEGVDFLRLGVVGYLNSYASPGRLIEAVKVIEDGGAWVGQSLMQKLITGIGSDRVQPSGADVLTALSPREKEIALLVADGHTNSQIGEKLYIAERTVKVHLKNIFKKCTMQNRLQLALAIKASGGGS